MHFAVLSLLILASSTTAAAQAAQDRLPQGQDTTCVGDCLNKAVDNCLQMQGERNVCRASCGGAIQSAFLQCVDNACAPNLAPVAKDMAKSFCGIPRSM
ncbi:hypothetical protein BOTBODRAFT_30488 [Botryobasidium botryosum FD-172 SS1]|uniref:Extracellular membrane protein CFEM domain-containing protein n=1 Tax=Botryobasidium botryosum (strain FD-172 SS1) TaxID=930990 RepID=A0A067MYY3_BOTB1|nr:hypothetical protein BOTBODRAFT_30488 [Botryobasidium botryosum FD-172 SS1]